MMESSTSTSKKGAKPYQPSENDHMVINIDDSPPDAENDQMDIGNYSQDSTTSMDKGDMMLSDDGDKTFSTAYLNQAELDTETAGLETEDLSFEAIEKNRQQVREELEQMMIIEKTQLEKFNKLKKLTADIRMFPNVKQSRMHTIAFELQTSYQPNEPLKPHPPSYSFKWDPNHVRMPCCPNDERIIKKVIIGPDGRKVRKTETVKSWDLIRNTLAIPIDSCDELNERINIITNRNSKLNVLKYTIEENMSVDDGFKFFAEVLPFIVKKCMDLPNVLTCPLPLLKSHANYSISLTQNQIASLLANAFFCTFPPPVENENYPPINFLDLYCESDIAGRLLSMSHKIRCIIHYFERLAAKDEAHNGVVTFTRKKNREFPNWNSSATRLRELVVLSTGTIESEGAGMLKVDFANKYIGGGVLGRGCVQEEILFVIYPELLVSRLFTEKLTASEALLVTGVERFSDYRGYATLFTYNGDYFDTTPFDPQGRRQTQITAIDALYFRKTHTLTQFNPRLMERELNKAYTGFKFPSPVNSVAIASGKWGCGAFNGNPELKVLLQLLAATESGRDLAIFTFEDDALQRSLIEVYEVIKYKTVGEIWSLLKQYYGLFCANNEMDKPPSHTLNQFFIEFVTAAEVDLMDSQPDTPVKKGDQNDSSQFPMFSSPMKCNGNSPAKFVNGTLVIQEEEEFIPIPKPVTPKKRSLADLYNVEVKTPAKIGTVDLDLEQSEDEDDDLPITIPIPEKSSSTTSAYPFSSSPVRVPVPQAKITTDEQYEAAFSKLTSPIRIHGNKRKAESLSRKLETVMTPDRTAAKEKKVHAEREYEVVDVE